MNKIIKTIALCFFIVTSVHAFELENDKYYQDEHSHRPHLGQSIQDQLDNLALELQTVPLMDKINLQALSQELKNDYQQRSSQPTSNEEDDISDVQFINYCLDVIHSDDTTPETKKAIVHLLQKRLNML